ncbi:AlbA family DNA-binding domain-containing protein [Methanosarcina acetivorans]|uniref:ATP-dependent DNA helicase n=1 Tax=Methanosarcina acetivorans (strain ATCC 35395 / DSM 2834 / JCM 12185 / C2A) TaxID=188937 RepID=Q8TNC1_METAC|nr:helix-turn-helix domain-containing protein [Methanosarcina acetivorans]AAM05757.1 ATP-dependent DNA helicase [Methanosarcina acetivorans C2A]
MNLQSLIKSGESETLEFKEKFDDRTVESAVAFANAKGGMILIGVSDKGNITGLDIGKETLAKWANQVSDKTEPQLIPEIEVLEFEGKKVVTVKIPEYPIKPVSVRGRCFKRVNNSNRSMNSQEIAEMHLQSTGMSWDRFPAAGKSLEDLDLGKVSRYIRKARVSGRKGFGEEEDPVQVLEKMELVKDGKPTRAAGLLFCKDGRRFLSQAVIHCGRFKDQTLVIDDRLIEGTLFEQVEEAMDFVRKNTNVKFVMTGKPEREEVWDYPLEAVREAVINAVCHRDYTIMSHIEIRIYDDELIVWSPGGLPLGLTMEDLFKPHASKLRNKGIAEVFFDTKIIEQWGSGIEKIQNYCREAGLPEPVFEEYQGFRVIFRKGTFNEEYLRELGLNERQIKAVFYVKENGKITNKEYQEISNTIKRTASRDLAELVSLKIFEQIGTTGKGTEYILSGAGGEKEDVI